MSREEVRQAFKTAVSGVYSGAIYTSRLNDNRNDKEFVSIYINGGDISKNFSGVETDAQIAVKFSKQNAEDAVLDSVSDAIQEAIPTHPAVLAVVSNPRLERFDYDSESSDMSSITLTYNIFY